ncbi:MAG: hypothetical protein K0B16_05920 [Burkholderiaceae bacterium]|nr:hypothetical protein [Burkholderiaceae bacterium]
MFDALRRRYRPGAPRTRRVTVRRHVSLWLRVGFVLLVAGLGAALAITIWQFMAGDLGSRNAELEREIAELRAETATLRTEFERVSAIANAADAKLTVERTAAQQLAEGARNTEAENARLRADLAYLESLLPASGRDQPVAIRRLRVDSDGAPNQFRYQALLTRGSTSKGEFSGTLALTVRSTLAGKALTIEVPANPVDPGTAIKVSFTHYQRIDGRFELPTGAVLRSVQMRLLEGKEVRAQQNFAP